MKTICKTLICLVASTLSAGMVLAQNTPAVITPTNATTASGIAPNGMGVSQTQLLFSQPYLDQTSNIYTQPRGIYSAANLNSSGGVWTATMTQISSLPDHGPDENYFTISPAAFGAYPAGSVFAVDRSAGGANSDDIYVNGSAIPFVSGVPDLNPSHAGVTFDSTGTFNNYMIVTTATGVYMYDSTGALKVTYPAPTGGTVFLESSTVAPTSIAGGCGGCLYVTSTVGTTTGNIYTVMPGTPNGTPISHLVETGGGEPENIQFITPNVCKYGNTDFSYFVSAYAAGQQLFQLPSNSGDLLGYTQSQVFGTSNQNLNKALVVFEGGDTGGTISLFDPATNALSPFSMPAPIPAASPAVYRLEGASLVTNPAGCTTCNSPLVPVTYNVHESNTINEIAWFNSHLSKLGGTIPTSTFQIFISAGTITFGPSTLSVPAAVITFSSTAFCSSTSFNTGLNRWEITLPLSAASSADEIFAGGVAYLIPSGFPQNVQNVTWSANVSSSAPGLSVTWQYGVSNWLTSNKGSTFPTVSTSPFVADYNAMAVDPAHNAPLCSGNPGDHAGAPEFAGRDNVLTGGGSGGGGSNWTGSWSSTPPKVNVCQVH